MQNEPMGSTENQQPYYNDNRHSVLVTGTKPTKIPFEMVSKIQMLWSALRVTMTIPTNTKYMSTHRR